MKQKTPCDGPPGSSASTLDHLQAMMRLQLEAIRAHDPGTRRGKHPEELHRMRTAARRLRAILRAVRAMLDPEWRKELRRELGWLVTVLGAVRDLDVFRQYLRSEVAALERTERPVIRDILARLDAERVTARHGLLAALHEPRYIKLLDHLEEAIQHPRVVAPDLSLPDIAGSQFKKLRKAVQALPKKPSARDLHAVRLKLKRARYAAELAQAIVGSPAERFVRGARKLQDILGEHQDAVFAEERLRLLLDRGRSHRVRAVTRLLAKRQRTRRQTARAAFLAQWPKLERRGQRAWT